MTGDAAARTPKALSNLHIRPRRGWLNDPNGMVRLGAVWHVFYQHNPAGAQHGDIHWGHVSSPDLVTWREHPVAFGPTRDDPDAPDGLGCWSGAFLGGLKAAAVVYTGLATGAADTTVCLRYAADEGLDDWSPPMVVATQPDDIDLHEMRDPYPFAWEGRAYALLGAGLRDGTPALLLYSCDDPHAWRFEKVWITPADPVVGPLAPAEIWECPQLLQVDGSWVLAISLWTAGRLEAVVAAVGSLQTGADGLPEPTFRSGGLLDEGDAFYAPQAVPDMDGPLLFGWVREEGAPDDAPPDARAGCLTLPRRLSVAAGPDGERVVSRVDPALDGLEGERVDLPATGGVLPETCRVDLAPAPSSQAPGSAVLRPADGDGAVTVDVGPGTTVWLDGEVVEVYPLGGVPATYRLPGATPWTIDVDAAEVSAVSITTP